MHIFKRGAVQHQGVSLTGGSVFNQFFGRSPSGSGINVNRDNAMGLSGVYRAASIITGDIAASQWGFVDPDTHEHSRSNLLDKPHPLFNAYQWREMIVLHIIFHGNAYLLKNDGNWKPGQEVTSLYPLDPTRITPKWVVAKDSAVPTERVFTVASISDSSAMEYAIPEDQLVQIAGLGFNGLQGISVIHKMAESLGTALAAELYAGKLYGSGSMMSGVLTVDTRLTEEEAMGLKKRWQARVAGLDNAGEIAVLDQGADFKSMTINPNDAQFIESRDYAIDDLARWFGVPTRLLMKSSGAQSVKQEAEQDNIELLRHGLEPMGRRITSALDHTIGVVPTGKESVIDLSRFEKGDTKTRTGAYLLGRKASYITVNEIREKDGLPRIDDERADDPFYPLSDAGAASESGGTDEGNSTSDQGDGEGITEPGNAND